MRNGASDVARPSPDLSTKPTKTGRNHKTSGHQKKKSPIDPPPPLTHTHTQTHTPQPAAAAYYSSTTSREEEKEEEESVSAASRHRFQIDNAAAAAAAAADSLWHRRDAPPRATAHRNKKKTQTRRQDGANKETIKPAPRNNVES